MGNELSPTWDPQQALLALAKEQELVGPDSNDTLLTEQRILRAGPIAADSIIHLARYGSTERIRLDASKYLVDRILGKEAMSGSGTMDPFQQLLAACIVDDKTKQGTAIGITSSHPDAIEVGPAEVVGFEVESTYGEEPSA
jgi:hypothetical protein